MRLSRLFGDALKESPAEAELASHQLLLRAGYMRQLSAGIFSYLTLGQRALQKIESVLREEMDAIDGQEINMPVVHPADPWKQSGRWDTIDASMIRFKERAGRDMLLAMTHEEIVAHLARTEIRSYKQLPQLVYQLQTKFRDEARSRGGLIRVREFVMKDAYSLDTSEEGLTKQYTAVYDAYFRIFARVDLPAIAVRSDVGMMGGKLAHEFMYVSPVGEDTLVRCASCEYAANREVARFAKGPLRTDPQQPVESVHTPGATSIEDVARVLEEEPVAIAKSVFFVGELAGAAGAHKRALVVAVLRGDTEVNVTKLQNAVGALGLRPANETEIRAAGIEPGYGSPVGIQREGVRVVVDDWVAGSTNLVAGANRRDYHLRNTTCGRDYQADVVADITAAYAGAQCKVCGGKLELLRGVETGNIFKLGTRYTEALQSRFVDEAGVEHPIIMGSYGIGVGRLLACIAEQHRDERGLCLPISVAPFQVHLAALATTNATRARAEQLYQDLLAAGVEVLYDDRSASAGAKLAEADLRGAPLRIVVSDRSLKQGQVELKRRTSSSASNVPFEQAVQAARAEIDALKAELVAKASQTQTWNEERERMLMTSDA